jgi:esterase/lipase
VEEKLIQKIENTKISYVTNLNNKGNKGEKVVLLSHGFASHKDKERFKELRKILDLENINYLFFDYPGHGESEKREFDLDLFKRIFCYFFNLLKRSNKETIILCESLGCLIASLCLKELSQKSKDNEKYFIIAIGPFLKAKLLNIFYKNPELFVELLNKKKVVIGKREYTITLNFIKQIFSLDYEELYNFLKSQKITVIYGEKDEAISKNDINFLKEKIDFDLIEIKDADHVISNKKEILVSILLGLIKLVKIKNYNQE